MKIDLVKQLINEFENSEVFKMKVEIDDIKLELEKTPVAPVNVVSTPVVSNSNLIDRKSTRLNSSHP